MEQKQKIKINKFEDGKSVELRTPKKFFSLDTLQTVDTLYLIYNV